MQNEILKQEHEGVMVGNLETEKTPNEAQVTSLLGRTYSRCQGLVFCLPLCATRKTPASKGKAPLQSVKAGFRIQLVTVDILGPLPGSENGNSYILVGGDYFTRWIEAYPIPLLLSGS